MSGLFLMNEGTGSTDMNLTDLQAATFSGTTLPTWNMDPAIAFAGGSTLNSYLNAGTDLIFNWLTPGQMTVVAKVFPNLTEPGGVVEKNDNNLINSGFLFGWDNTGALKLTVEKASVDMSVTSAPATVPPGRWSQVAFTWDGTVGTAAAAHLYVNGVEQPKAVSNDGSGTLGSANATNQPLRIGNASFDTPGGSLNGQMAYLAVYKGRILTPTQLGQFDSQPPIDTSDFSGTIVPNGSPVTITTSTGGQNAQLSFSGSFDQKTTVALSSNTIGAVTVSLLRPDGTTLSSATSSAASFSLPVADLSAATLYRIYAHPTGSTKGHITVTLTSSPARPSTSVIDSSNALSTDLVGLFLMNEGTGSTDKDLVDAQPAVFSGTTVPTWNTTDPSGVFAGGASPNSYLNAGADLTFDQLPTSQVTIVAKVNVSTLAAAGVCEKNDNNTLAGFLFGWDSTGALKLTVEKSSVNMTAVSAAGAFPTSQWVQVAFTWDGTVGTAASAHLYVNGVEQTKVSSSDGSGTLSYANATSQPFRIGNASFDTIAGALNGKMAYLAVYRGRILTTTELGQLDAQLPIH
jgi:hypothetical protein